MLRVHPKRGWLRLAFLLLAGGSAAHAASPSPSILRVEEIRPGMKGYGLTVFRGTEPERFPIEVVDVLHGFRPNQELILVKTPHPLLDRAHAVAGMSGSPIYIDGKLVGAYAYGFAFSAEPVVGVTPAAIMLEELARPVRSVPPALTVAGRGGKDAARLAVHPIPLQFGSDGSLPDALAGLRAFEAETPRGRTLVPVATPLMLGGFGDEATTLLESIFGKHGYLPLQAGGAGPRASAASGSQRFVDGGALSVTLVRGDMSISAVGTVTHVGPNGRLIAFGHPMMNQGEVFFPTALARVLHVFVSQQRSFKIAEPLAPRGTLVHDRQSAIVVDENRVAETIPMRVRLHGVPAAKTEWNVELVSHRLLSAPLAFAALTNVLDASVSDRIPVRVRARTVLHLDGRAPIELVDEGTLDQGPGATAPFKSLRLFALLEAAFASPFGPEVPKRIEVDLHFTFGERARTIVGLSTPRTHVEAGSTIPVLVRLASYDQPDVVERVMVKIPSHLAGQKTTLVAAPAPALPRAFPRPRRFDDLVRYVSEARPSTSLGLSLTLPSRGLRFDSHVVDHLPASALAALQSSSSTDASTPFDSLAEIIVPVDAVLDGKAELELFVTERRR
ncbi:MAG: hypothetical protein GXY23_02145 [Myxococcales bacterium]|nr:hypothetical protein [Myxococcales bacterium]